VRDHQQYHMSPKERKQSKASKDFAPAAYYVRRGEERRGEERRGEERGEGADERAPSTPAPPHHHPQCREERAKDGKVCVRYNTKFSTK
jgi:hypothetical protein